MRHLTLAYLTLNAGAVDTVTAAAVAGFKSVGLRITGRRPSDDYPAVLGNPTLIREIRHRIADKGLRLSNVTPYSLFPEVTMSHLEPVIETAAELGARAVIAICNQPNPHTFEDTFGRYCELAAKSGIRIVLEFMRFCEIKTIEDAERAVVATGQENATLLIDALHLYRSGGTADQLAKVSPQRIGLFQLCDAPRLVSALTDDQLRTESRTSRLPPGTGDVPLYELLDALPESVEIEYEVPRTDHLSLPLTERATLAERDFRSFMTTYTRARGRLISAG